MQYDRIARVSVGKTNRNPCDLIDVARRQVDHLGPSGICAKRGQTNDVFLEQGYLQFVFRTFAERQKFADRVEENCHEAVQIKFLRKRRSRS